MGAEPETVDSPSAGSWIDDPLFALLDKLRGEGFPLGVGDYLQAQLAAEACHRDGFGGDPRRLRNYLAPVLCSSPEQQEIFYRRFDEWWGDRAGGREDELAAAPQPEKKLAEVVRRTRPWKWWALAALGATLVVCALAWWSRPVITVADKLTVTAPPLEDSTGKNQPISRPTRSLTLSARVVDLDGQPVPQANLRGNLLAILEGHTDSVFGVSFSPDGRRVVTASRDGTARIWDAETGEPFGKELQHSAIVWTAVFTPDGQRVATVAGDRQVRMWEADGSGRRMASSNSLIAAYNLAFSPDGRRVATTLDRTVRVQATNGSGKSVYLPDHRDYVLGVVFSPDGSHVVTTSDDRRAMVWAADGSGSPMILRGHEGTVHSAAFSSDGKRIVTTSRDQTARVWDAETGKPIGKPLHHEGTVIAASFGQDGKSLTTVSRDGRARIWDIAAGEVLRRSWPIGSVTFAAISPDGTRAVTASGGPEARIWSIVPPSDPSILPALGTSNEQGEINLTLSADEAPGVLFFSRPGYHSPASPFILPANAVNGTFRVRLAPLSLWERLVQPRRKVQASLALLPLLIAGPWLAWRVLRRRQLILERRTTREEQAVASPAFPEPSHELYRGTGFARARVEVQRRQSAGTVDLDPEATVEATIRRLGFFTPVYRARLEPPAYLVLVDRVGVRDQRARMVDEILDRLQAGNVDLVRYDFDRDPRRAFPHTTGGAHRDLEELAGLYPRHRLAVFTDGAGFTEPATGRLAPWTRLFSAWLDRALLTPAPPDHWGRRELALAAAGFAILPASEEGIEHLADLLRKEEGTVARPPAAPWQPPYPDLLAARPGRFLERHTPRPQELDELCEELAFYLGPDGYRWLGSLAVYPDLDWYLTLHLGLLLRRLDGGAVLDEATLMALTRLPWLRHGAMPDWLRLRLLRDLPAADEQVVRGWMHDFLEHRESPGSRFHLDVARPPQPAQPPRGLRDRLRHWIERMDGRRLIKDLAHSEPRAGALRDQIFVSFLLGKKPSRLQVMAPRAWRRWVWEQGLAALGLRTGFVLGLTALLALLGLALGGPGLAWLAGRYSQASRSKVSVAEAVQLKAFFGECIEVGNDDGSDRRLTKVECADLARQLWRIEPPSTSGYSRLQSLAGEGQCLDANLGIARCDNTPQQRWNIESAQRPDVSRLRNLLREGRCLDTDPLFAMTPCSDSPNQLWEIRTSRPILVARPGMSIRLTTSLGSPVKNPPVLSR